MCAELVVTLADWARHPGPGRKASRSPRPATVFETTRHPARLNGALDCIGCWLALQLRLSESAGCAIVTTNKLPTTHNEVFKTRFMTDVSSKPRLTRRFDARWREKPREVRMPPLESRIIVYESMQGHQKLHCSPGGKGRVGFPDISCVPISVAVRIGAWCTSND